MPCKNHKYEQCTKDSKNADALPCNTSHKLGQISSQKSGTMYYDNGYQLLCQKCTQNLRTNPNATLLIHLNEKLSNVCMFTRNTHHVALRAIIYKCGTHHSTTDNHTARAHHSHQGKTNPNKPFMSSLQHNLHTNISVFTLQRLGTSPWLGMSKVSPKALLAKVVGWRHHPQGKREAFLLVLVSGRWCL